MLFQPYMPSGLTFHATISLSVLLVWIRMGQGPTVLAVGADRVVWIFVSRLSYLLFFLRVDIDQYKTTV